MHAEPSRPTSVVDNSAQAVTEGALVPVPPVSLNMNMKITVSFCAWPVDDAGRCESVQHYRPRRKAAFRRNRAGDPPTRLVGIFQDPRVDDLGRCRVYCVSHVAACLAEEHEGCVA